MEDLRDYAYLWEDPKGSWVLAVTAETSDAPIIFDRETRQALIIEDDDVYVAVIERMKKAGIETIDLLG
jgi:hypothetical protein